MKINELASVRDQNTQKFIEFKCCLIRTCLWGSWKCVHFVGTMLQSNTEWINKKKKEIDRNRSLMLCSIDD